MQTIGIDCRFAATHSGLGRYTRELVTELLLRSDPVRYVLFLSPDGNDWLPSNAAVPFEGHIVHARHYSLAEQLAFPRALAHANLSLFFAPHFNVPVRCPVPFVATIHDLILHRYPNLSSFPKRAVYRAVIRNAVKKSRALIAVSQFTAHEVTSFYGEDLTPKIRVIHEAASPAFTKKSSEESATVLKQLGLKKPFFLYVGNAKQHKNVQMLIDAFASLRSTTHELALVVAGAERERLTLKEGVRLLDPLNDHDLACLYSSAVSFITASLYEGFGLPVLESAQCGCPVIVTSCGALPEIAPKGSVIVAPTVETFAHALRNPPSSPSLPSPRTWSQVAAETWKVFAENLPAR